MTKLLALATITLPVLLLPGCANASNEDGQRIVGQMGVALLNAPLCLLLGPGCIATGYALGTGVDQLIAPEAAGHPVTVDAANGGEMVWPKSSILTQAE